jgi:hypothetical protein
LILIMIMFMNMFISTSMNRFIPAVLQVVLAS